jgi:hypothetical protein
VAKKMNEVQDQEFTGLTNSLSANSALTDQLSNIGKLIGLIKPDGSVDTGWFGDPVSKMGAIDKRLGNLVSILTGVLGKPVDNAPAVFPKAGWYAIPNPKTGTKTPLHVVMPSDGANKGQIGLGMLSSFKSKAGSTIQSYIYVPLFTYDTNGASFVLSKGTNPLQLGVSSKPVKPYSPAGTTFDAVNLDVKINLDGSAPSFKISFVNLKGTTEPSEYTNIATLFGGAAKKWFGTVISDEKEWFEKTIGISTITRGQLLIEAQLIVKTDLGNYELNMDYLMKTGGKEVGMNFLYGALKALAAADPLIDLPGGGLSVAVRHNDDESTDYGLRVCAEIPFPTNEDSKQDISLSLGSWLTDEDEEANWVTRATGEETELEPGVTVFLINKSVDNNFSFKPEMQLCSIGLNIAGANESPLFNKGGYTLNGAQLRANLFSADWGNFGFAARLDSLGFPLGPGFNDMVAGENGNMVAQSLLQSGTPDTTDAGDDDPINPAFSIAVAYIHNHPFSLQLFDKDGEASDIVLIPVQRSLGPLYCDKIGIGWMAADSKLSMSFDGNVKLAALNIALQGLTVAVPLSDPTNFSKYEMDLEGMGITFSQNAIEMSAALLKVPADLAATPPRNYTSYNGTALFKGGSFTISALGSYAYVPADDTGDGYTSLFIFGIFIGNLGGPPFFYVTGLAAGFGYNRAIVLPDMYHVTEFPLVAALNDPTKMGSEKLEGGGWSAPDPMKALTKLNQYVPPERGQYWLAAGVRFSTFDLLHTSALLVVQFGNELEIGLLGLSWMSLPPPGKPGGSVPVNKYAYAELGLQVRFLPERGFLGATAILTSNSFVIDPACKLTGGYAFYAWFGNNEHAGEFVLTLGGYHPDFIVPAHFPVVPRLGFSWQVSSTVSISGSAYFALTGSAVMVGAGLQILFKKGDLNAWFTAHMDAYIVWAPFRYLLDIGVSIGASYRMDLWFTTVTLKVELGANLTIWGPKMGGTVHISWYIISFSIDFGADRNTTPPPLQWKNADGTGFSQSLMPNNAAKAPQLKAGLDTAMNGGLGNAAGAATGVYAISVEQGLLGTLNKNGGEVVWIVRPDDFVFSAITTFPATEVKIAPGANAAASTVTSFPASTNTPDGAAYQVCIRPMKATMASSVFRVKLTDMNGKVYDLAGTFDYDLSLVKVAAAKWGKPVSNPEPNAMLNGRMMGLEKISPIVPTSTSALRINITKAFAYDILDEANSSFLPLSRNVNPSGIAAAADGSAMGKIKSSLMDPAVIATRTALFSSLQQLGIDPQTNGSLSKLASAPGNVLTGNPFIVQPA